MIDKTIKIPLPKWVKYILETMNEFDYECYIVGGCVRDSLLRRTPKDWDITTNAEPKEVIEIFESLGYKIIPTGLKHGTVTVVIDKGNYEITTYRVDGGYSDGRHPDSVTFTRSLKEDLSRRDFTINAMAYNENEGLVDYFGGIVDLKNKIIRCVGNPEDRFNDDNLRRLRAIRFACQLGFEIDNLTYCSLALNPQRLMLLSVERIREELCKILLSDHIYTGFKSLWFLDMLKYILPELEECYGFNQHNIHHDKDVFEHIMAVIENTPANLDIRLAALLHDIGKPKCFTMGENYQGHFIGHHKISADMSREILTRLKFDNKTIDKVCKLIYEHMSRYDKLRTPNTKKFINRVGIENLDDLFELQIADIKGATEEYQDYSNVLKLKEECHRILNEKQPLSLKDLKINGCDLMGIGYKKGRDIGIVLNKLLDLVLDNPGLNSKEILLKEALNMKQ